MGITKLINKNVLEQIASNLRCIIRPQLTASLRRDYNGFWLCGLPQLDVGSRMNTGGHVSQDFASGLIKS